MSGAGHRAEPGDNKHRYDNIYGLVCVYITRAIQHFGKDNCGHSLRARDLKFYTHVPYNLFQNYFSRFFEIRIFKEVRQGSCQKTDFFDFQKFEKNT